MKHSVPEDFMQPSHKAISFLKLFARNYRAIKLADGEYLEMLLS